jgi:hypothetical protein
MPRGSNTQTRAFKVLSARGYTMNDLQYLASNITYFNAAGPAGQLTLSQVMEYGTYAPGTGGFTLQSMLAGALAVGDAAFVVTVTSNVSAIQGPLPEVVLAGNTPVAAILWHEFWHAGLGLTDAQAVQQFGITSAAGQSASTAFQKWLANDCNNP